MTEAKSTPNTRANSLFINHSFSCRLNLFDETSRILGDYLSIVDYLHRHDNALKEVLEYADGMFRCLALP